MKKSLSSMPLVCSHTLTQSKDSVLALALTQKFLFAGTQSGSIHVLFTIHRNMDVPDWFGFFNKGNMGNV